MGRLAVTAYAKVNLHLEVLGRREDGFHEVRTLLASIDLADELEAEPADDGVLELQVEPAGAAPTGPENLVLRAAAALWEALGRRPGARLRLRKRVPSGAGLGGGSADAAAALVLLPALWGATIAGGERMRLAAALGSDVPFFLVGGLALGFGRGAEIVPLPDLPALEVAVLVPPVAVPTAEAYGRARAGLTWRQPDDTVAAFVAGCGELCWGRMRNDLQDVVTAAWPAVGAAIERLPRAGALRVAMSGSGSAVFAAFAEGGRAAAAVDGVTAPWRAHAGRFLPRAVVRPQVRRVSEGES